MGKVYTDKTLADKALANLRENERFFRYAREYKFERQPIIADWEDASE